MLENGHLSQRVEHPYFKDQRKRAGQKYGTPPLRIMLGVESINTHFELNYVIPLSCFISLSVLYHSL